MSIGFQRSVVLALMTTSNGAEKIIIVANAAVALFARLYHGYLDDGIDSSSYSAELITVVQSKTYSI